MRCGNEPRTDGRREEDRLGGGRGCLRKCIDHLERTVRIEKRFKTPMVEGEQCVIEEPLK